METPNSNEHLTRLTNELIALANKMKDEGSDIHIISAALMSSSAIYATYTTSGNEGYLHESGINKVADTYKKTLTSIQQIKKDEVEQKK